MSSDYILAYGTHASPQDGRCAMEWVSYLAGEPHSDQPTCVSPVLRAMCIALNDGLDQEPRQRLRPYLTRTIGTAEDGLDTWRGWMAMDWLARALHARPGCASPGWPTPADALESAEAVTGAAACATRARAAGGAPAARRAPPARGRSDRRCPPAGRPPWRPAWPGARPPGPAPAPPPGPPPESASGTSPGTGPAPRHAPPPATRPPYYQQVEAKGEDRIIPWFHSNRASAFGSVLIFYTQTHTK